jgi:endonuclease/exonuclease/phosphatase family metal-dependent hydrolase
MNSFLLSKVMFPNKPTHIGTFQLHSSKEFKQFRIGQLKTIKSVTKDIKNLLLLGDFNFGTDLTKWKENEVLYKDFDLIDAFYKLFQRKDGFTEDTQINQMMYNVIKQHKQERFDRILYTDSVWTPSNFKILGQKAIKSNKNIWPSDHFCIVVELDLIVKQKGGYKILYYTDTNEVIEI